MAKSLNHYAILQPVPVYYSIPVPPVGLHVKRDVAVNWPIFKTIWPLMNNFE